MENVAQSLSNHYTIGYKQYIYIMVMWYRLNSAQRGFLDNSVFQIEEESQINEKARRRHCALQFSYLLNAEQIDRPKNG